MLEGEHKSTKNVLAMWVTIGGDSDKNGKNTLIMRTRISQIIGMIDLKNQNQFKKGNGYRIRTKSVRDYWGM